LLHRIFQNHHIPPHEVYAMKDKRYRMFMYASEMVVMDEEEKQRKELERKQR